MADIFHHLCFGYKHNDASIIWYKRKLTTLLGPFDSVDLYPRTG
jgi:hypothetical protein